MSPTAARAATPAPALPQEAWAPRRGLLRAVPHPSRRVARGPFVAGVLVLLAAGLLGLLLLNTVLAQGSFHLHALQVSAKQLGDQEQGLQREVDALQAPAALAAEAQRQGMVPAGPPVFLHLPDGTVLGQPTPAPTPTATLAPAVDVPPAAPVVATPTPAQSAKPTPAQSAKPTPTSSRRATSTPRPTSAGPR